MALGADRRDVLRLVLRETLRLVLLGVALGIPAALRQAGWSPVNSLESASPTRKLLFWRRWCCWPSPPQLATCREAGGERGSIGSAQV